MISIMFKYLFIALMVLNCACFGQTLFEDSGKSDNQSVLKLNTATKAKSIVEKKKSLDHRFVSSDLMATFLEGNINLNYEIPKKDQWSMMLNASVNPQDSYNDITGSVGLFAGARHYFPTPLQNTFVFLQGMAGFHHINNWELCLMMDLGQRVNVNEHFFMDIAINVVRSYASTLAEPMVYLDINFGYKFDAPLFSFL